MTAQVLLGAFLLFVPATVVVLIWISLSRKRGEAHEEVPEFRGACHSRPDVRID